MDDKINIEKVLPSVPEITQKQLDDARKSGNYEFIAFEHYKFVAQIAALVSRIDSNSNDYKQIKNQHLNVLRGLMNRCARLMLGTMELSHKGKFGETASIIFRCIFETGVKIIWLCKDSSQDKFDLYINDGLKPEIELKQKIYKNIQNQDREATPIEKRMLKSIDRTIKTAETTEEAIKACANKLNVADIVESIELNRLIYVANHKMGSHYVHGTWPSLLFHYLEEQNGEFVARNNNVSVKANQLVMTSLIVAKSVTAFSDFVLKSPSKDVFLKLCVLEEKDLVTIFDDMSDNGW